MKEVIKAFCEISGHRVNLAKSKAFFSRNINFNSALELSDDLGIGITEDLRKYLGVPLLHSRATKLTYFPIIQNARKRTAGWKSRFLTMAGQTLLIKVVLSALPTYQMQTILLPKGVLKELEKISRTFLWNQGQHGKKRMGTWN
ncbi:hypothetical protein K1719_017228 [Acacia pycnantha]|nr:hypothetical protein K1719_017228 [Acacia pycnantha]